MTVDEALANVERYLGVKYGTIAGNCAKCPEAEALAAGVRRLRDLSEWQAGELGKRMACQQCGLEPEHGSEIYPTVCASCRRCYACAEPMCPTCGDREGTKQRAIDLLKENATLRQRHAEATASRQVALNCVDDLKRQLCEREQRHAEAVEACWQEAFRAGLLAQRGCPANSTATWGQCDAAWLASEAKARLEGDK